MSTPLSQAARQELQTPAPVGQRHAQLVRLACLLRGAGWSATASFHRLRASYDPASLPDSEIAEVIKWAGNKLSEPVGRFYPAGNSLSKNPKMPFVPTKGIYWNSRNNPTGAKKSPSRDVEPAVGRFLDGFSFAEPDLFDASPVQLPGDFRQDASLVFENLYSPAEKLNVVSRFREQLTPDKSSKTSPLGFGETFSRDEWLNRFRKNSIPESQAGAWFRINPVNGAGISDADISEFRFALLESDCLPLEIQISLLAKLPIPICAILASGGKSLHAWVRIAATNAGEYREKVIKLFSLLAPFGFDTANKNPSRLSRLPGAQRVIGAIGDGKQRLLYLNPNATERSIA